MHFSPRSKTLRRPCADAQRSRSIGGEWPLETLAAARDARGRRLPDNSAQTCTEFAIESLQRQRPSRNDAVCRTPELRRKLEALRSGHAAAIAPAAR